MYVRALHLRRLVRQEDAEGTRVAESSLLFVRVFLFHAQAITLSRRICCVNCSTGTLENVAALPLFMMVPVYTSASMIWISA